MLKETIGFIGGGNMASSLMGGLIARGLPATQMMVADPVAAQRELLASKLHVRVTGDNLEVAQHAQILVLAVKPQVLHAAASSVTALVSRSRPLVISVVAGIRSADLQRWLGGVDVVRAMPNTPALHGCGVTALFATVGVPQAAREIAQEVMGAVGPALWVPNESDMDTVTAVSGSGPAYFFLLIEMLEAKGVELGLQPEVARRLAVETAYGAGSMARASHEAPAVLRERVTSKGGTTEAALKSLEAAQVRAIFSAAIGAAAQRSAEMAEQLGRD